MTLDDIRRCLGLPAETLSSGQAALVPTGAGMDSRAVKQGDLFFCLAGSRVDGHDFAVDAAAKGAAAVIAARDPFAGASPLPLFIVPDPAAALGRLAACHRDTASAVVVGITGTSGKTSVKETLAAVLAERGPTEKTPMNLNNQIGLPLSMLNADPGAAFWVMEAGISEPKDMDELGAILRPDLALILNAGPGHTQALGDRGTAHYKSRLLAHLTPQGRAVVSADYPDLVREASAHGRELILFSSRDAAAPYRAEYLGPISDEMGGYRLHLRGGTLDAAAPFQGSFGAENVAAVSAVAHSLGLDAAEIAAGLARAVLPAQRFNLRTCGAFLLIDDSYNANPLSMERMLEAAEQRARRDGKQLLLVLGEMGELGAQSDAHHRRLGTLAAAASPVAVLWKGGRADMVAEGLREKGYQGSFVPLSDEESFRRALAFCNLREGVVLFKGSRSNKLETLVSVFKEMAGATGAAGREGDPDAV